MLLVSEGMEEVSAVITVSPVVTPILVFVPEFAGSIGVNRSSVLVAKPVDPRFRQPPLQREFFSVSPNGGQPIREGSIAGFQNVLFLSHLWFFADAESELQWATAGLRRVLRPPRFGGIRR